MGLEAVAYELPVEEEWGKLSLVPELKAEVISQMPEDELARARAHKLERQAGRLILDREVESVERQAVPKSTSRYANNLEVVQAAAEGEAEAVSNLTVNVFTDTVERTLKAGHISEIELEEEADGKIRQYGQSMDDVLVNNLVYANSMPEMEARSAAETRNGPRMEAMNQAGKLENNYFVVISMAADNMSMEQMRKAGFFTDTMSCSIQVTTRVNGKLMTESAFVAGTAEPGAPRHDAATIVETGRRLGVDLSGKTAAEIIDMPLLIPKALLPNGAVDIVKLYDESTGLGTFYGQAKPVQDYLEHRESCRQREAQYQPRVGRIVQKLISEAHTFRTTDQLTKRLQELSQSEMVDQAIADDTIDARVFGSVSAGHIEEARAQIMRGEFDKALESRASAQETAESYSCPSGRQQGTENPGDNNDNGTGEFSRIKKMTCPFCGDSNQYGDPCSPNQHCTACEARVTGGKVTNTGNGGRKGRKEAAAREAAEKAHLRRKQEIERAYAAKAGIPARERGVGKRALAAV